MFIKMLAKLRREMKEYNENFSKNGENIKKNQSVQKDTITWSEWYTLGNQVSKLDDVEEWDSDLEERLVEMTQSNQEKETRNEDSLRNFWNNIKHAR